MDLTRKFWFDLSAQHINYEILQGLNLRQSEQTKPGIGT
jgi:hypothetical protein